MKPGEPDPAKDLDALGALGRGARRRLYEAVPRYPDGVTRDEVAASTGVGRPLVAYHLDQLVDHGLLSVRRERRSGRTGPGSGRPANVYSRSDHEISVNVPPRDYPLLARLLTEAIAKDTGGTARLALDGTARRVGREIGDAADLHGRDLTGQLLELLSQREYEPVRQDDGTIRLTNCPFHAAARDQPEIVCGMNEELLAGLLEGVPGTGMEAVLDPAEGYCCVVIRPAGEQADPEDRSGR